MTDRAIRASHEFTKHPDLDMFRMHTHDSYEIYCFISGSAKYYIEGTVYTLQPYDILLIKKGEAHTLLIEKNIPYERIVINFDASAVIGERGLAAVRYLDSKPLGRGNCFRQDTLADNRWAYYLDCICKSDDTVQKQLYLSVLLSELYDQKNNVTGDEHPRDNFTDIINYINTHLNASISLDMLCDKFFISKTHLNRRFKKMTGSTVWEYIKIKRLIKAKELLQGGIKPTKACLLCGFNDYSTFFYAYRSHFGVSPKQDMKI